MNWLGGIGDAGDSFTHKPLVSDSRRAGSVALIYGICCPSPHPGPAHANPGSESLGALVDYTPCPPGTNLFLLRKEEGTWEA